MSTSYLTTSTNQCTVLSSDESSKTIINFLVCTILLFNSFIGELQSFCMVLIFRIVTSSLRIETLGVCCCRSFHHTMNPFQLESASLWTGIVEVLQQEKISHYDDSQRRLECKELFSRPQTTNRYRERG